jgi:hypothetical protein
VWLILAERGDEVASWAYSGLLDRGLDPIEIITPELLAYGRRWVHRLTADGVSTDIELADGRRVVSTEVRGVLNRLAGPFGPDLRFTAADRDYARHEMTALVTSWLTALDCPVLNRPPGHGVSGPWRHVSEWRALAVRSGLPIVPYQCTGSGTPAEDPWGPLPPGGVLTTTLIVGDAMVDPPPASLVDGCRRLTRLADADLLGLTFVVDDRQRWAFLNATPMADLSAGGTPLLDLLAVALGGKR